MTITIENEYFFPSLDQQYYRKHKNHAYFYVILLQKGKTRYLKVGTTTRTPFKRFQDDSYKKYNFKKPIYVAEIAEGENAVLQIEDLTRCALRDIKGFGYIKNDRFTYFQLPEKIPVYTDFNEYKEISIKG